MDKAPATLARATEAAATPWEDQAQVRLHALVASQPVLVQISAAKRLRDRAEQDAREAQAPAVTESHVARAGTELGLGEPA
jgi:chlorophyllide a reductase subunit Z